MSVPLLNPDWSQFVEAVAQRVLELLDERDERQRFAGLVDAQTLAEVLGVDRGYVYRHRAELGAIELGTGRSPRLRFDVDAAKAAMARSDNGRSQAENPCTEHVAEPVRGRPQRRQPNGLPPAGSVLPIRAG